MVNIDLLFPQHLSAGSARRYRDNSTPHDRANRIYVVRTSVFALRPNPFADRHAPIIPQTLPAGKELFVTNAAPSRVSAQ
jgi:hypothetical protein